MTAPRTFIKAARQTSEKRIGSEGLWSLLRRHMVLGLLIIATVVGLTYVVLENMPKRYTARSTLVMTLLETRVRATDVQLESFEMTRTFIETQMDVLRSSDFATEVAVTLELFDDPDFVGPPELGTFEAPEIRRERVVDKLLKSYDIFRDGESLAFGIVAVSENPEMAAAIANQVADTFIVISMLQRRQVIEQSIAFLRDRVQQLGENLSQSELELADFIRDNDLDDERLVDRLRADLERASAVVDILSAQQGDSEELAEARRQLEQAEETLHEHTRSELSLMRMERSMELQRARYQTSIEKLNEFESQLQFTGEGARQVSVARVPVEPSWPNVPVALVVSAVVGFSLAFVIALLMEGMNNRLWTEDQTVPVSGVPNLCYLPRIKRRGLLQRQHAPLWFLLANPYSAFSEALRGLLTLWFNSGESAKLIMVTSGLPDEGKSTLTVSLALTAAREGMRVLVLDLDAHRQGASKLMDLHKSPVPITEVLSGELRGEPVVVDGREIAGLEILPVRTRAHTSPQHLKQLLNRLNTKLRYRYDLVLVDAPPVLIIDDACRFGPLVDATVVVVRWGETTQEALSDTMERLEENGMNVLGTVINQVDLRKHRRHGYGGNPQYYHYAAKYYR
ncbi:capsular exopolysaccharide family [Aliiruegeria lutimaris]|uniref:Capsular exopolysaccharide family n=2 Tax=Aliiruegeria lutimaris TaxID=571298 RepID=A0A1G9FUD0_9RHOB|nr:capsular exopolysaccharide family [Aliiruegeria lutimaris]